MANSPSEDRTDQINESLDLPVEVQPNILPDEQDEASGGELTNALPTTEAAAMRTILGRFSKAFIDDTQPLIDPMQQAVAALDSADQDVPARRILPNLRDLQQQLQTLIEKVDEQQAYVLIFGPLKSGKSTFMNAMCSAYVSEVTCLPAYPCMVCVSHADSQGFTVSHYDGKVESFEDPTILHGQVTYAHRALVKKIREVEAAAKDFDPVTDSPESIRRIDVKIPAGDLAQSGAMLVDTPGLYSRMKFGYDRMTREFRDGAACAIFVVKTDNLFLEQVFEEFHELLELFSRIFLIVNLDSSKKDLRPDGSVVPSLEHEDPKQIIDAFENLAMSSPIKIAADEGRLRIYPVDLLGAASTRMKQHRGATSSTDADSSSAEIESPPQGQADFDALLTDLTDYLNSSDYLRAFIVDSLKRCGKLLDEMDDVLAGDAVNECSQQVAHLERQLEKSQASLDAAQRLKDVDWKRHLIGLDDALAHAARQAGEQITKDANDQIERNVNDWFDNESSFQMLAKDRLRSILDRCHGQFVERVSDEIRKRVVRDSGGLNLSMDRLRDLVTADIKLDQVSKQALDEVDVQLALPRLETAIDVEDVPVRKSVVDWLLFRSLPAVRRKLLGPANEPTLTIPPQIKAKRIGEDGRAAIIAGAKKSVSNLAAAASAQMPKHLSAAFAGGLSKHLAEVLQQRAQQLAVDAANLTTRIEQIRTIDNTIGELKQSTHEARENIAGLDERYGEPMAEDLQDHATL